MNNTLSKLNAVSLAVIASSLAVIAFNQWRASAVSQEPKIVYVDATSGRIFEQQSNLAKPVIPTDEKLRREYPDGRTY